MIVKVGKDWEKTRCKMKDIKKGDIFYTVDGAGEGPLLRAEEDARQRAHTNKPGVSVWGCKARFADKM